MESPARAQSAFGGYRKRKAGASDIIVDLLETNDAEEDLTVLSAAEAKKVRAQVRGAQRVSGKALRFPSFQDRVAAKETALQSLRLTLVPTNGFKNNCLWFSANIAAGKICSSDQYGYNCQQMSEVGRAHIQEELLRVWPAACDLQAGIQGLWWAGHSRCSIISIFDNHDLMKEPHIYALANLMEMPIAMLDMRTQALNIRVYYPGYHGSELSLSDA